MDTINNMTTEQILTLTDEQINRVIDYQCAVEGVPLINDMPTEPTLADINPSTVVYQVGGFLFANKEDAEAVVALVNKSTLVELGYMGNSWDCKYRYIKPSGIRYTIDESAYLSQSEYKLRQLEIDSHLSSKKEYERALSQYDKHRAKQQKIRDYIYGVISEARSIKQEQDTLIASYGKYLDLAGGDEAIAQKFFALAIPSMDLQHDHKKLLAKLAPRVSVSEDLSGSVTLERSEVEAF